MDANFKDQLLTAISAWETADGQNLSLKDVPDFVDGYKLGLRHASLALKRMIDSAEHPPGEASDPPEVG